MPAPSLLRPWNIRNAANAVPVIELFGDIGASKEGDPWWGIEGGAGTFEEFASELREIGPVPELRVEIHSYGGSVIVGKGIHDKLREHPAVKTAVIYGVCASAATYPALACEKIQIPANSLFLIHESTGCCWGTARDMDRVSANLKVCDNSIASLYVARTGKSEKEIRDLMERDTWITGTEAVELGLATEVIEPITIEPAQRAQPANFRPGVLNSMPETARAWFDMRGMPSPATNAIHPMFKNRTPLMNAAEKPGDVSNNAPAPGTSSAPANPPAAPANQAPAAQPPAAPAAQPPAAAAPANQAAPLTLADITNAVTAAVKPLQDEINNLKQRQAQGVTPENLGGGQIAGVGNEQQREAPKVPAHPLNAVATGWKSAAK